MADSDDIYDLLEEWDRKRAEGRDVPLTVLCAKSPHLVGVLYEKTSHIKRFEAGEARARIHAAPLSEFDGYTVVKELGRGGMGVVYECTHPLLDRPVAIKRPTLVEVDAAGKSDRSPRFTAEAKAASALKHPNIVEVKAVGCHSGVPYLVMEHMEGGSLEARLTGGPLPVAETVQLLIALSDAMAHCHSAQIIHRDLKPGNVLYTRAGDELIPKISDFGVARRASSPLRQTATGAIIGSPQYLSPEQASGKYDVGPWSDVYGLGAILYHCLTARPPYVGTDSNQVLAKVTSDELPDSPDHINRIVPRDVATICLKCLSKDPGKRYQTARDLQADLLRFVRYEPIHARRPGLVERSRKWSWRNARILLTGGAAVLALVGAVYGLWQRGVAEDSKDGMETLSAQHAAEIDNGRRQNLAGQFVAAGNALLKNGKHAEAALEFVAAIEADSGDAERCRWYCARVRSTLERIPRLLHLWRSEDAVRQIAWAPDNSAIAILSAAHALSIWDPMSGRLLDRPADSPIDAHHVVTFSSDGNWLLASGKNAVAYSLKQKKWLVPELERRGEPAWFKFRPDGQAVAIAVSDGSSQSIVVTDVGNGHQLAGPYVIEAGRTNPIVQWSPGGRYLIVRTFAGLDSRCQLLDTEANRRVDLTDPKGPISRSRDRDSKPERLSEAVTAIAFHRDDTWFVTVHESTVHPGARAVIWNAKSLRGAPFMIADRLANRKVPASKYQT